MDWGLDGSAHENRGVVKTRQCDFYNVELWASHIWTREHTAVPLCCLHRKNIFVMKKLRKLRVLVSVVGCLIRIRIKTLCHLLDFMQHPLQMQSNNQHCSPPNWHLLGVVVLDVVKMCSNKFVTFICKFTSFLIYSEDRLLRQKLLPHTRQTWWR